MKRCALVVISALLFAGCAGMRTRSAEEIRYARYTQPREVVWDAVREVLGQKYEILEEYEARGIMVTGWRLEFEADTAYRSRVTAWIVGPGPYRVEFDVEMYTRQIDALTDARTKEGEQARADELYRALHERLRRR